MQHILFPSLLLMASQSVVTLNLKCRWMRIVGNTIFVTEVLGHGVFYFSVGTLVSIRYSPCASDYFGQHASSVLLYTHVKIQASHLRFTSCQVILVPATAGMTPAVCLCPLHWTLFTAVHYQQKLFLQGRFPCSTFHWTIDFVFDIPGECLAALDRLYLTCHWKMDHSKLQRREIIQDELW